MEEGTNNEISFSQYYERQVYLFITSNSLSERQESEKILSEYQNDHLFISNLLEVISETKISAVLFVASASIENLLKNYNESIEESDIEFIFQTVIRRLRHLIQNEEGLDIQNDPNLAFEFQKCRINLLKNISLINLYHPEYLKEWQNFSSDDAKILFCFLFEEEERQIPNKSDDFQIEISKFTENEIKRILKEASMSPEWLELFKYAISKASKITIYLDMIERLSVIPNDPILYPAFIEFLKEVTQNEYFYLSMDEKSVDFVELVFDTTIELIEKVLEPPFDEMGIQMAAYLWSELLDYDPEFLTDRATSFGVKAINIFVKKSLPIIIFVPKEFYCVLKPFGETMLELMNEKKSFVDPAIDFLGFLINKFNENNGNQFINNNNNNNDNDIRCENENEDILLETVRFISQEKSGRILNYLTQIVENDPQNVSPGLIYVISSSGVSIRDKLALKIVDNVINLNTYHDFYSNYGVIVMHFIAECCGDCGQRIIDVIDIPFANFSNIIEMPDEFFYCHFKHIARTIVSLTKVKPQLVIDLPEQRFLMISKMLSYLSSKYLSLSTKDNVIIINLIQALINIMNYVGEESCFYKLSLDSINQVILNTFTSLYEGEKFNEAFDLVFSFSTMFSLIKTGLKNAAQICESFLDLFTKVIYFLNISSVNDEILHGFICHLFTISLESGLFTDKDTIMTYIYNSVLSNPIPDHINLLTLLYPDIFPPQMIIDFIKNIGNSNDNEMMISALNFLLKMLKSNSESFFWTFPVPYIIAPLKSADNRIVDISLEILSTAVECVQSLNADNFEAIMKSVVDGIFNNFGEIEIRKGINLLIKLVSLRGEDDTIEAIMEPQHVIDYVLEMVGEKSAELSAFAESLNVRPFDRLLILKAVTNLKVTIAKPPF